MRTFAVLIMTALVVGPALAQPPGGRGRGMGGGFGGGAMLLNNPGVQKELKLSEDQIKKATEFGEKMRADMPRFEPGTPPDPEKMAELRKKMTEASDKFVKETLTAEQGKRLKEIQLQQGGLFAAANNEQTSKALKLTDDQKEKIKEIAQQQQKDMRELFSGGGGGFGDPETQKKVAALRKEASAKALETLTTDQKKTWEEMTGKPFEIQFTPGQGGGFGKGKNRKPNPDKDK